MSVQLTSGFAASVYDGSVDPDTARPTLQVLSVKKINQGAGGQDRYRCVRHAIQVDVVTEPRMLSASSWLRLIRPDGEASKS